MKIALGVTGSIACYKAYDLVRNLVKKGHQVRVILTGGSLKFIKPDTFLYLGAEAIYQAGDDFNFPRENSGLSGSVLHIELTKWADKLVIAPMSANKLAQFSSGMAEDLLTSTFLAWPKEKPILIFPAMNTKMFQHPIVENNFSNLSLLNNLLLAPTKVGELACGDSGEGKLLDIDEIQCLIETWNLHSSSHKTLISAGATVNSIDSVRFVTNASTGKTAIPFVEEYLKRGQKVCVVAGRYATKALELYQHHPHYQIQRVADTNSMAEAILTEFSDSDLYIATAAIGDFTFSPVNKKLKKNALLMSLPIEPTQDILAEVLRVRKPHQKVIGFAAESTLEDATLLEKFKRKPVDLLIATEVTSGLVNNGESPKGFGTDEANYRFILSESNLSSVELLTKCQMAFKATQFLNHGTAQ